MNWYPSWKLYVSGAAAVQQETWSRLIEISGSSPQFLRAIQTLETLGLEETDKEVIFRCTGVKWECKLDGADVYVSLWHDDKNDTLDGIQTDLRRFFNAGAPLIMQLGLPLRCGIQMDAIQMDIWQYLRQQVPMTTNIYIRICDLTTTTSRDLIQGLIWTPINSLSIEFDQHNRTKDPQATISAGVLVHRVYEWSQVSSGYTVLMCTNVFKGVLAAICSIVATTLPVVDFIIHVHYVDSESWPWLVYAVSCTPAAEISLTIWFSKLETSDISSISKVVRYRFPFSKDHKPLSIVYDASEFGYVDIVEGTTLWLVNDEDGQALAFCGTSFCPMSGLV
ncbi:hypothetical protein P3T76_014486 [Phytophthora citrophthora]|uniref:Uncharacterized protein n=1 Tax=Phytophthora citrophthora TaxID=4793 RepID=A0AAD9G116_9STRA|nr:hypothetical protein P3T76_014486 [Phytophthora citrophthora]